EDGGELALLRRRHVTSVRPKAGAGPVVRREALAGGTQLDRPAAKASARFRDSGVTRAPLPSRSGGAARPRRPAGAGGRCYADSLSTWSARHQITLDFSGQLFEEGQVLTARVRISATAAIDVLRSLEGGIRDYEHGEIHRPRRRDET